MQICDVCMCVCVLCGVLIFFYDVFVCNLWMCAMRECKCVGAIFVLWCGYFFCLCICACALGREARQRIFVLLLVYATEKRNVGENETR